MSSEPEGRFHTVDASSTPSDSRNKTTRTTLIAADGVRIEARYRPGPGGLSGLDGLAVVVAHGFTGSVDRPAVRRVARAFAQRAAVITFSFRGHGHSTGRSTVGDREVLDLAAAVRWARALGHTRVATVGFSMGGAVALRHAALYASEGRGRTEAHTARTAPDAPLTAPHSPHSPRAAPEPSAVSGAVPSAHADAVVAVSAPARWHYRGTAPMRRLHWVIGHPLGRLVGRYGLGARIHSRAWDPIPLSPTQAVPLIAPAPLLIVHGDRDPYFPLDHPRMLAAAGPAELWIEAGMGHAENAADDALLDRVARWLADHEPSADGP